MTIMEIRTTTSRERTEDTPRLDSCAKVLVISVKEFFIGNTSSEF
jgi:hypothetical protein